MNINKHNVAMRWITRRRTNEVAGLYESFPGTFSAYQEALSSGFQGTMEEFMQIQSIPQSERPFTGKVGGLVEPGVRLGFDRGGMANMIAHLKTLKPGTKTNVPKLMEMAKKKGWELDKGSLSRMLHDVDAKQVSRSTGKTVYLLGEARRNEIKDILKNITVEKAKTGYKIGAQLSNKTLKKYNKIAKILFDRGEISSPNYLDIKKGTTDHHMIMSRKHRKIKDTRHGPVFESGKHKDLHWTIEEKIMKEFPEADFTIEGKKGMYGFDVDSPAEKKVKDWIKRDYKHTLKEPLTTNQIADIKERFKNRVPAKDWNFLTKENPKGFIWGLAGTGKGGKYEGMQNSISNYLQGKTWFDRFAPGLNADSRNYLLTSFERIAEHEDKAIKRGELKEKNRTYKRIKNKDGKIIGFQDNTPTGKNTKYYMVDSGVKGGAPITDHPGYAKGAEIARYVEKMKGMEIGGAKFNDLISESMKTKPPGYGVTPWQRHHIYGTAKTRFGGLPGEVMLLTRDQNFEVEKVRRAFERSPTSRYGAPISWAEANKQLKKIGAALDLDGRLAGEIVSPEKTIIKAAQTAGLSKADQKIIQDNLDDFCTQKVALGGRIGFAGCTAEQILDNMKKDQQKLLTYQKTGTNAAEAARIAEKFRNASGKIMKLGSRGLRVMFGPALLWGEPLFEGAFVAHDMIGNKTPFAEALSKTYFAAPLKWTGILKEPEEYEAEALYRKRGDPGVEVIGARGMKRLERDKPGIIPGVKAYTDARNKLMKINDLRSRIGVMEDEVESGVTLGAADALSSLKKQLSKEMSDIRYDEKSLHNIMKKNEQQHNIAVESQRAERFKDVDPYEKGRFDPYVIGTGRDKRYEEMAEVNRGRDQNIYGQSPMNRETYNLWSELANTPGEHQALAKQMIGWVDQMGGPDLGPYKKMLAQGVTGPANKYTLGQVTTPADRYHWDKIGKLAELGGFSYEKAFGGRVPFGKGGMSRRRFLEIIGALAGGTAAFKTGLLKIIKGSTGKTVIKAGDHIITNTPGMPDWFFPLVNRIVKEGDDVTAKLATQERQIVHTAKIKGHDVDVYQDLTTGDIRVSVEGQTGKNLTAYDEGLELEYKAGEVIEEGKYKGKKTDPEFSTSETEAGYVRTGPDDAELDFGTYKQGEGRSISDTNFLKNYAKQKKSTMKEIVETGKKKKQIKHVKENPHEDPRIPEGPDPDYEMFDEFGNWKGD